MPTIPQEYGEFARPTLIVAADSARAKLFRAEENRIELLEELESGYPPKDDVERSSGFTPGGAHFAEQHEKDKIVSRERLYASVAAAVQKHDFEDLVLCAPDEHLEELRESMPLPLLKRTVALVPKLLTTEDWLDVALHVKEEIPETVRKPMPDPHLQPIARAKNRNRGRKPV